MKGQKTGGRRKGTPNKATAEKVAIIAEASAAGQTPMDFMLGVMRDGTYPLDVRLDAAKAVAPYVHPKLATIEHTGKDGGAIRETITVTVKREREFFGGRGAFAGALAAPDSDSGSDGAVQDGGVRPAMGQNGVGTNGVH